MDQVKQQKRFEVEVLVVGGGVAATTFVQSLNQLRPNVKIAILCPSDLLKEVSVVATTGRTLDQLVVKEIPIDEWTLLASSSSVVHIEDSACGLDALAHTIFTASGGVIKYKYLCICTGARPLLFNREAFDLSKSNFDSSTSSLSAPNSTVSSYIVALRDTESVDSLTRRLGQCRKILLLGNGGIATELIYELKNCHITWAVKDQTISATFFDPATANFFVPKLTLESTSAEQSRKSLTSRKFKAQPGSNAALGPDWNFMKCLQGTLHEKSVTVLYGCHVESITQNTADCSHKCTGDSSETTCTASTATNLAHESLPSASSHQHHHYPVTAQLSNGQSVQCDLIISATGVVPNTQVFLCNNNFQLSPDGAFKVNRNMETSVKDVYAAGDVCYPEWENEVELWVHMRLWTQARKMALYAAHCIDAKLEEEERYSNLCHHEKSIESSTLTPNSPDVQLYFNFDIFSHVTSFFGYKVVLLGLFNGQKLNNDYKILFRQDEDKQCIKIIIKDGKVKGAILIGETDLEETFENLIMSEIDVSRIEDQLLDGTVDIEDYFD